MLAPNCIQVAPPSEIGRSHPGVRHEIVETEMALGLAEPELDHLNPDPSLRPQHLCGLNIIWGLQSDSLGHRSSGWLYEPQDGVIGRTEILIRDPELTFDGRC
jgi:hypothetical protein